ncbi:hypothetical protein C4J87_1591 [Pseudomonas sp. R1-43-08]|nr:hypothetical protein C4J87_1591 [Pseudomonas sp. R1-43-08]
MDSIYRCRTKRALGQVRADPNRPAPAGWAPGHKRPLAIQEQKMKHWNNLDDTIFFNKVFSYPVEIGKIYIHAVNIENDRPDVGIGFDIPEFPDRLPEKWKNKSYNTCRIGLKCLEVSDLKIANLPKRKVFTAKIEQDNNGFLFTAKSKNASIEFKAKWLFLAGPSVYMNCPEPGDHDWSDTWS